VIEPTIINKLLADAALRDRIAVHAGSPAIFTNEAPENCTRPLLVITVHRSPTDFHAVQDFSINVNIYGSTESTQTRKSAREIAERVEFALDDQLLQSDRYGDVRISFFSGDELPSGDPRDIDYNCQFSARATRTKWMIATKV
jgi:hypothetical protein